MLSLYVSAFNGVGVEVLINQEPATLSGPLCCFLLAGIGLQMEVRPVSSQLRKLLYGTGRQKSAVLVQDATRTRSVSGLQNAAENVRCRLMMLKKVGAVENTPQSQGIMTTHRYANNCRGACQSLAY